MTLDEMINMFVKVWLLLLILCACLIAVLAIVYIAVNAIEVAICDIKEWINKDDSERNRY